MDYMRQLNAFGMKSAGILSPGAVNLYVRLFLLNNQHNWAEYFPASYSLLKMLIGIESNNSINRWQQELIDKGFIEYKKGGGKGAGKKPNLYKLIPLYDSQTGVQTGVVTGVKTGVKTGDIKDIDIDIDNTPLPPEGEARGRAPKNNHTEERFDEFWKAYPKKVGKGAALKAYNKLKPNAQLHSAMLAAIERQKQSEQWQKERGQYIPNPSTWLNQSRWEDELPSAGATMQPASTVSSYADFLAEQKRRRLEQEERDRRIAALARGQNND